MINIVIAEDQLLFREGFINLIQKFKGMNVCAQASNGKELLNNLANKKQTTHVAIIDLNMPEMNGIETMKELKRMHPSIKNIILTVHEEEKYIYKIIQEGANAYLAKNSELDEVEKTIRNVVQNDFYFNASALKTMHSYMQLKSKKQKNIHEKELTPREKEVLLLICEEHTSHDISKKLFLSESTVNGHRNNLLLKTGCKNTAGLILFAIRNDLFDPNFPNTNYLL